MIVLAIDDEPTSLLITYAAVQSLGHECHVATDGTEGWVSYRTYDPDVIISDWSMPGLTGLELCRLVRAHETDTYAYFIMVTSHKSAEDIRLGMNAGADDYLVKPLRYDDLEARMISASRVTSLRRQLEHRQTALKETNRELNALVLRDPLTGLGNRRALEEDLAVLEARVSRYGHSYCIGLLDIDNFKSFNDTYGHQSGDEVLLSVANQLRAQVRSGDALYRYGGDELLCLFPEQSIATASVALERMRAGVEGLAICHSDNPVGVVTLSGGLARMDPDRHRPVDEVLKEADRALYRAKDLGRNRLCADETNTLQ